MAQNRIKNQADKNRTDREFQVGDQVLLKLQSYAQSSLVNKPFPKLSFKYFGPYTVLELIGRAAYRLELPSDSYIHPVFHTSQLKQFVPNYMPAYSALLVLTDLSQTHLQPEAILERRLVKGNSVLPQVCVKLSGLPDFLSTWEDWTVLVNRFSVVSSWGQYRSPGGGGVTPEASTNDGGN
jgi:hypothetical protein